MKLSVCLITYNHEAYVRTALESVLDQEVDFPLEIVVADDASVDGTVSIIEEYRAKHPDLINPVGDGTHRGVTGNFAKGLRACQGEYIALLEGDDYWTDSEKLSSQVAFLDRHPECALSFHPVTAVDDGGRPLSYNPFPTFHRTFFELKDLLTAGSFVPTGSIVLRNGLFEPLPQWFFDVPIADFPLNVLMARHGRIARMGKSMGAWRLHGGGSFSSRTNADRCGEVVRMYDYIDGELGHAYSRLITGVKSYWQAVESVRVGDEAAGRKFARRRVATWPPNAQWAKACVMATSPALYRAVARRFAELT
ncbi:MAG TPA: glycosyltransferase [Acidimicrobiales bacterium]|nr:glycosyltransferase [Acidimicrobiales bacterium]